MNVHSQPQHGSTRDAILRAALELFAERGFHGTPVPLIAEHAGIAAGTIYRHFASKDELVNVLYRQCKTDLMSSLIEGFPLTAAPRAQFRAFWFRIATFARSRPTDLAFLELHHHAPYLDQESLALEASSLAAFYAFFDLPATRKLVRPLPAKALVAIVWGILAGIFKFYRLGHLTWSDDLVAEAERCAWNAVAADDS